ncbi:uncharacterized protein LOC144432103 [Styela clava]
MVNQRSLIYSIDYFTELTNNETQEMDTLTKTYGSGNGTTNYYKNTSRIMFYDETAGTIVDIISVSIAVISFYIFIAQAFYCAMRKNVKRDSTGKYRLAFHILCIFAAFSTFLRVVIPVNLAIKNVSDQVCNSIYDFKVVMYFFASLSLWTILWVRQRYFYSSSALIKLNSTFIKVVSNGIEVIVILGALAGTIQYFPTRKYFGTPHGCLEDLGETESYIWAVDFGFMFLTQLTLLALFIYPLWKHKRRAGDCASKRTNSSLNKAMTRAVVILGICMVINLACIPIIYVFSAEVAFVFDLPYDVSLVMQLLAEVALFKNWRIRFFPWLLPFQASRLARRRSTVITHELDSSLKDTYSRRESHGKPHVSSVDVVE